MNDKSNLPLAVHVFLEMGGKVLLLRRRNTGFHDGEWSVPAGRVEPGEPVLAAAVREAKEEIGVDIDPAGLAQSLTMLHEDEWGEKMYIFFRCVRWNGDPQNMEPDKCAELAWHEGKTLPDDMISHVRKAFELMH